MSTTFEGFPSPLGHLRTFRMNQKHIPTHAPGFYLYKAHWMSSHFLPHADNFELNEEAYSAFLESGDSYNLEVYADPAPNLRELAEKAVEGYLKDSDVSDIVENADYHSRMILSIIVDEIKTGLDKLGST